MNSLLAGILPPEADSGASALLLPQWGRLVPRFRRPSSAVNYCIVYLAGSRDLTNFIFLDLVFWFRIKRDGVHVAMALTVEK